MGTKPLLKVSNPDNEVTKPPKPPKPTKTPKTKKKGDVVKNHILSLLNTVE